MSSAESESLFCEDIIVRAVDQDHLKGLDAAKRVRKSAFIPRKNGNDNDGLSVTRVVGLRTLERLRMRLNAPHKAGVTLHVGSVREIKAGLHWLEVKCDPCEADSEHALIIGFPKRGLNESTEDTATLNQLAELLAEHARCCLAE